MKILSEIKMRILIMTVLSFISLSCGIDALEKKTDQTLQPESRTSLETTCKCSDVDANALASKIVSNFTQSQNQLESQNARVMRIELIEKRDNCTWVATFKISWPFGNTDGAHPDSFLKKRFICDGKEIYTQ